MSRRESEGWRVATHGIDGLADTYECGVTVRQLVPRPLAGCGDALLYPELLGAEVGVCQGAPEIIAGGIPADVRDAVGVHEVDVVDLIARTRGEEQRERERGEAHHRCSNASPTALVPHRC